MKKTDANKIICINETYVFDARADRSLEARFVLLGDANGDGRVTSADATLIARWLVTSEADRDTYFPDFCHLAADIDGYDSITVNDVVLLARWLVGHNVVHLLAH